MINKLHASTPSSARRWRAALLFLFFAVAGSLIRLSRPDFGLFPILAPLDFHGTSPNFFVCAGAPFIAFFSKDVIGLSYYVKSAMGTAVGLTIYEFLQLYLPRRTFDPYDIVASFVGALFSILLAYIVFFVPRECEPFIVDSDAADPPAT